MSLYSLLMVIRLRRCFQTRKNVSLNRTRRPARLGISNKYYKGKSSYWSCSIKNGVFCKKISQNWHENTCVRVSSLINLHVWGLQLKKRTPTYLFSCDFCKIFNITFYTEHLRTTAFARVPVIFESNISNKMSNIDEKGSLRINDSRLASVNFE